MKPKAIIETAREGEVIIVHARYWTPEWVRFLETIWRPLTLTLWFGLSITGWRWMAASKLTASTNEAVFWGGIISAAAFAVCWAATRTLIRVGGGFGLAPRGKARLTVWLGREQITWRSDHRGGAWDRKGVAVRFLPRPHRSGRDEERDAINGQGNFPLSYAYRDGWEIWLQVGERFFDLAAVSSEADADAIVRRLQAADLEVTRPRQGARRSA